MSRKLVLSAFRMNTNSHITHGLWRHPESRSHEFNDLAHWIDLAKVLERGTFDTLFLADIVGVYAPYRGSTDIFVEEGLQIPSNDPSMLLAALAAATEHLGLTFTSSILQEHPFSFARRVSTLDHLSRGRVGWNIVTNALDSAAQNFGHDAMEDHDERYRWADEYVDVAYKL
ncbi:LLM class flavin-dependent oxidoreductase, partial [Frankia sp. EI5c]|uniref:LLM class flavin-dependent oxidoreductase n=1 Tax=Frankia sp. EI5c TaxID=683316 RepID=UPI0037BFFC4F